MFRKVFLLLTSICCVGATTMKYISWFGLETEHQNFMCTWSHDIKWNIDKIQETGFNGIRVPFSYQYIKTGDFTHLDDFFHQIESTDLAVVLDFHRLYNTHQSAKPYDYTVSFDDFLWGWKTIIQRYESYPNLKYIDIFNEYQSDNYVEWNSLARQIIAYIESEFPNNTWSYLVQGVLWGGNLHFVDLQDLNMGDRLHYTIHKYWFSDRNNLWESWDYSFGPFKSVVVVGEWGFISTNQNEVDWANQFVDYLLARNITDTIFWTWSYNSGDTGGILKNDCESVEWDKINLLKRLWRESRRYLRGV